MFYLVVLRLKLESSCLVFYVYKWLVLGNTAEKCRCCMNMLNMLCSHVLHKNSVTSTAEESLRADPDRIAL